MRSSKVTMWAAAALLLSSATAQAVDGLYESVMAGLVVRDSDLLTNTGYGFQGLIGAPLTKDLNWEVTAFCHRNGVDGGPGHFDTFGLGGDVMWPILKNQPLRPFALAGAGFERDSFTAIGGTWANSPYFDLGVGVLYPVNSEVDLRAEFRSTLVHFDNFPGGDNPFDYRFNVGFGFGGDGRSGAAAPQAQKVRMKRTKY